MSRPHVVASDLAATRHHELDDLFGEQVGSVDKLGWYGLVKHEDRPGAAS